MNSEESEFGLDVSSVRAYHLTPSRTSPREMRRRLDRDGYLYIRALLPSHQVEAVRQHVSGLAERHRWCGRNSETNHFESDLTRSCIRDREQTSRVFREMWSFQGLHQ